MPRVTKITPPVRHATGDMKLIVGKEPLPITREPIHQALTRAITDATKTILEEYKIIALTQTGIEHITKARTTPSNILRVFDQDGTILQSTGVQLKLTIENSPKVKIKIEGCPGEHFYNAINFGGYTTTNISRDQVLDLVLNYIDPGTTNAIGSEAIPYPGILQAIEQTPGTNILLTKATDESMNKFLDTSNCRHLFNKSIALNSERKSTRLLQLQEEHPELSIVKVGETAGDGRAVLAFNQKKPNWAPTAAFIAITHPENAAIYGPEEKPDEHLANMLTLALPKKTDKIDPDMPRKCPDIIIHNSLGLRNLYDQNAPVPTYTYFKQLVTKFTNYDETLQEGAKKVLTELETQFHETSNPFL